ncbi:MAG: hypothetical protein ABIR56_19765, partial [Polaromonas sp.]
MTVPSTACAETPFAAGLATSAYSRYVQRIRRRYAEQMPLLPAGEPVRATMQTTLDALLASGLETGAALRVLRQLVMERLVGLDCGDGAPTLPAARGSLPPEGALRLRPGEAGSVAPGGEDGAPMLPTACGSLPPEGALRLRPGKAGSAAPAGFESPAPTLPAARGSL